MSKIFLITGVGGGLGRAFAQEALAAGHRVVGTVREPDQIRAFEALAPGRATGMELVRVPRGIPDYDAVFEPMTTSTPGPS